MQGYASPCTCLHQNGKGKPTTRNFSSCTPPTDHWPVFRCRPRPHRYALRQHLVLHGHLVICMLHASLNSSTISVRDSASGSSSHTFLTRIRHENHMHADFRAVYTGGFAMQYRPCTHARLCIRFRVTSYSCMHDSATDYIIYIYIGLYRNDRKAIRMHVSWGNVDRGAMSIVHARFADPS